MAELLSLFAPFYNEEAAPPHFANAILPVLNAVPNTSWEIICVDDGSTEGTRLKLLALAQTDARFRVLEFSRNFGTPNSQASEPSRGSQK